MTGSRISIIFDELLNLGNQLWRSHSTSTQSLSTVSDQLHWVPLTTSSLMHKIVLVVTELFNIVVNETVLVVL